MKWEGSDARRKVVVARADKLRLVKQVAEV